MILKFNKIYIIESLQENDSKTGKYLYEGLLHHNDESGLYGFHYYPIANSRALNELFDTIINEIKTKDVIPLLHFEMHGGVDGIQLSSEEIIPWIDLSQPLQKINILIKNKLVIIMALCHGIHFISTFYKFMDERAPIAGIISTADIITEVELKEGFSKFYKSILNTGNGNQAIKELNDKITNEDKYYSFLSCRWFLLNAFIEYLKLCSAKKVLERTENLITNIKTINASIDITRVRKEIKQYLHKNNQRNYFESVRNKLLMYDLDENNRKLYCIEYEEVLNEI